MLQRLHNLERLCYLNRGFTRITRIYADFKSLVSLRVMDGWPLSGGITFVSIAEGVTSVAKVMLQVAFSVHNLERLCYLNRGFTRITRITRILRVWYPHV